MVLRIIFLALLNNFPVSFVCYSLLHLIFSGLVCPLISRQFVSNSLTAAAFTSMSWYYRSSGSSSSRSYASVHFSSPPSLFSWDTSEILLEFSALDHDPYHRVIKPGYLFCEFPIILLHFLIYNFSRRLYKEHRLWCHN